MTNGILVFRSFQLNRAPVSHTRARGQPSRRTTNDRPKRRTKERLRHLKSSSRNKQQTPNLRLAQQFGHKQPNPRHCHDEPSGGAIATMRTLARAALFSPLFVSRGMPHHASLASQRNASSFNAVLSLQLLHLMW